MQKKKDEENGTDFLPPARPPAVSQFVQRVKRRVKVTVQNKAAIAMENDEVLRGRKRVEVLKVIFGDENVSAEDFPEGGIPVRVKLAPHDVDLVANLSQGYPSKDPPTFEMRQAFESKVDIDRLHAEFFELWQAVQTENVVLFDCVERLERNPR